MKKIGYLYDNISRNTGDLAVGLSVQKMLLDIGVSKNDFEEMIPGISNPNDYENIIIGGGLLLRDRGDFFYDKFRIKGNFILNSVGVYQKPLDLNYLNNYKYLSVRSEADKDKLNYLTKKINVVPDTTLLLEDTKTSIEIKKPSIGIHCYSNNNFDQIDKIIKKYSNHFYIYLIPITFYNYDYEFLEKLYFNNKNIIVLPQMSPLEIFTTIGKFNYFISYSLHGAYFSYRHNTPFILFDNPNDTKMKQFMNEHGLDNYLFCEADKIDSTFNYLINNTPDYSKILLKDLKILELHKKNISQLIEKSKKIFLNTKKNINLKDKNNTSNSNFYANKTINLMDKNYKDEEINILKDRLILEITSKQKENISLQQKINSLQLDLNKIQFSKTYKLWQKYNKLKKIFIKK